MSQPSLPWRRVNCLYLLGLLLPSATLAMRKERLYHVHAQQTRCDDESSGLTESESSCPFKHSTPLSYPYAQRTLDWLSNPHKALKEQGYLREHLSKHRLEMFVIRHRLPTVIEQYYRHLAIPSRIEKSDEPGYYDSLNFPGELITPEQTVLHGVFEIGSDPARNNEICHRYFHYAQDRPEFAEAFRQHNRLKILFAKQMRADLTLVDIDPAYTIQENHFMVRIIDRENSTYVLYKNDTKIPT